MAQDHLHDLLNRFAGAAVEVTTMVLGFFLLMGLVAAGGGHVFPDGYPLQ